MEWLLLKTGSVVGREGQREYGEEHMKMANLVYDLITTM